MTTETKRIVITVTYWRGTNKQQGLATTYRGALRIASRNQNAWSPRFYDQDGKRLYDDGNGLAYEDQPNVYAV